MPEAPDVLGLNPRVQGWQVVFTTLSDNYKEKYLLSISHIRLTDVKHQSSAREYWFYWT